jgi:phospholipase C
MFLEDFMEKKHGKQVVEENISAWRRSVSGDLTSCFRPHDPKETKLSFLDRDHFVVGIQKARYKEIPSGFKKLNAEQIEQINRNPLGAQFTSHQEKGIRPSSPLPYELYADGGVSPDGTKFQLRLKAGNDVHGRRSAGSPFNVYLRNTQPTTATGNGLMVATYAVKAEDTISEEIPLASFADGRYSIDIHGPNGFYRSFNGDSQSANVQTQILYERQGASLTGNVKVHLHNSGAKPVKVTVQDNSYGTGSVVKTLATMSSTSVALTLKHSYGWYDFTVKVEGSRTEGRFAGRVETGRSSFSDPLMGGILAGEKA